MPSEMKNPNRLGPMPSLLIGVSSAASSLALVKVTVFQTSEVILRKWQLESYFGFFAALFLLAFPLGTQLWRKWPMWARACSSCALGLLLSLVALVGSGLYEQGTAALARTLEEAGWMVIPLFLGVAFFPLMGWLFALFGWILTECTHALVKRRLSDNLRR